MRQDTKFSWWGWLAGLCLVPVVYLLSVFPVILVVDQFNLVFPDWLNSFYEALIWAAGEWKWFRSFLEWMAERMGLP
jgi:uncharacterized membrane protein YbhN (UPF0104 family)